MEEDDNFPVPTIRKERKYDQSHAAMILRVRRYFEQELRAGQRIKLKKIVNRTASATGVSESIVCKIKTEKDVENWRFKAGENLEIAQKCAVPNNFSIIVRQIIRDTFLAKKKLPTVDHIYEKICDLKVKDVAHLNLFEGDEFPAGESNIWIWSRSTLYRFMKRIGFVYEDRVTHYEHTRNREDIIKMRDDYLDWIRKYREEGRRVYYQDETWVFKNMSCPKVWKDIVGLSTDGCFMVPSGKGERSILSHIGCAETGLLDGCMLLFRGSKSNKNADYHSEMNWNVLSHWCETTVFPKIAATGKSSVVVLDRATYHTVLDDEDRKPVMAWNKARLIDSIKRWGGAPDNWPLTWAQQKTKHQLLDHAKKIYPTPKYKIQKIADKFEQEGFSIKILFLPVAHPELNPIEMVWAFIKRTVASENMSFKLSHVEQLTLEQVQVVTAAQFSKYYEHTRKEEDKYRYMSHSDSL